MYLDLSSLQLIVAFTLSLIWTPDRKLSNTLVFVTAQNCNIKMCKIDLVEMIIYVINCKRKVLLCGQGDCQNVV